MNCQSQNSRKVPRFLKSVWVNSEGIFRNYALWVLGNLIWLSGIRTVHHTRPGLRRGYLYGRQTLNKPPRWRVNTARSASSIMTPPYGWALVHPLCWVIRLLAVGASPHRTANSYGWALVHPLCWIVRNERNGDLKVESNVCTAVDGYEDAREIEGRRSCLFR